MAGSVRWWDMRPAKGGQAKTYTCPICHRLLLAMNPNTLLYPEGDHERRRHAHTACVVTQRKSGNLLTKAEWERSQRPPQLVGRGRDHPHERRRGSVHFREHGAIAESAAGAETAVRHDSAERAEAASRRGSSRSRLPRTGPRSPGRWFPSGRLARHSTWEAAV
jgi:hypothetical protein